MGDRTAGGRVDRVGIPPSVLLEEVAVVSGGGHTHAVHTHRNVRRPLTGGGALDGQPPGHPPRVAAEPANLAPDLHQVAIDPELLQPPGHPVDPVALRDCGEVDVEVGDGLAHRGRRGSHLQMRVPHAGPGRGDVRVGGYPVVAAARPEAPEVHQRPDGDVEGPPGQAAHPLGLGEDRHQLGRGRHPAGVPGAVEAREFGVRVMGRHGPIHGPQHSFHLGLQELLPEPHGRPDHLHRVGGPHGGPRDLEQPTPLGTGHQEPGDQEPRRDEAQEGRPPAPARSRGGASPQRDPHPAQAQSPANPFTSR